MKQLIDSANIEIEPIWTSIFAKALEGKNVGDFLMNVGSSVGSSSAAPQQEQSSTSAPAKKEEKKEEKDESDDDMGFGNVIFKLKVFSIKYYLILYKNIIKYIFYF